MKTKIKNILVRLFSRRYVDLSKVAEAKKRGLTPLFSYSKLTSFQSRALNPTYIKKINSGIVGVFKTLTLAI